MSDGARTEEMPRREVGRILATGAAITGTGAVLGAVGGALAAGDGGFWMFVGMGIGAVIAVFATALQVMRTL